MAEPWILAVDLGTGGPKTGAVSLGGELLAVAHRGVGTRFTDGGGAEQDPEAWWRGIREGVAEVLASGPSAGDAAGVGITGQWGSTVPVGVGGTPRSGRAGSGRTRGAARLPQSDWAAGSTSWGTRRATSSRGCA